MWQASAQMGLARICCAKLCKPQWFIQLTPPKPKQLLLLLMDRTLDREDRDLYFKNFQTGLMKGHAVQVLLLHH